MKNVISSTLDHKSKAKLISTILVGDLINQYKKQLSIDVSNYFNGISEVGIYKCEQTNYRFYYPYNIVGDSVFYQQLQKFDWYYMPWKWEHETTKRLIQKDQKILEIGSGAFDFVERMKALGFNVAGLELNRDSINKAKDKGLNAFEETIEEHSKLNKEKYDVVCSFQVLEHISDVHSFIEAQVNCLKKKGKLIIAVPNNDSFIRHTRNFVLNSPPHHMGLWNLSSLKSIATLFNMKIEKVLFEPLQEYQTESYINLMIQEKINNTKLLEFVYNKLKLKKLFRFIVLKNQKLIKGHTMLMVYTKL